MPIPEILRLHAQLDKEVVTVGVLNHAVIWARDRWEAAQVRRLQSTEVRRAQAGLCVRRHRAFSRKGTPKETMSKRKKPTKRNSRPPSNSPKSPEEVAGQEPRQHPPAMVEEVLACLRLERLVVEKPDAVFIDGTLGTAGHTLAMLEAHPTCRVVAFDRDAASMEIAKARLEAAGVAQRVTLVQGDFRHATELLQPYLKLKVGTDGRPITQIDGALVDAGMSLYQVTWQERGLSFRSDAPLDMRYDRDGETSAFDLVNYLSSSDLEDLLFKFADERWARRIAETIAEHRRSHLIHSTSELTSLIEAAIPVGVRRQSRVHPATQTFAALRLAVNDEFWALDHGAWALSQVLANTARLVFLTYSSHEDRTVKRTFSPPCRFADSRNGIGRPKKEPRVLPERA